MLKAGVPNLELHIYGNGGHGGGLTARGGIPFGTWTDRFVDWFKDLGFLGKDGGTSEEECEAGETEHRTTSEGGKSERAAIRGWFGLGPLPYVLGKSGRVQEKKSPA